MADCQPSLFGRNVSMVFEIEARPILAAERSLAYVVVSNLLRNACAHTHAGTITVTLKEACFIVRDSGIGMPAERFPTLMERHVKGEHSTGFGLGLSIVARVCDQFALVVFCRERAWSGDGSLYVFPRAGA